MASPLSLEPLLLALREAGPPVGAAEVDRLRQVLPDGAEFWRRGYGETPLRLPEAIRHSLVVLVAEPQTPAVETLAADLLAGGQEKIGMTRSTKPWRPPRSPCCWSRRTSLIRILSSARNSRAFWPARTPAK